MQGDEREMHVRDEGLDGRLSREGGVGAGELTTLLRLAVSNRTVMEIASEIGYSPRQTERLLRALYGSLGVKTRQEAAFFAGRLGLVAGER